MDENDAWVEINKYKALQAEEDKNQFKRKKVHDWESLKHTLSAQVKAKRDKSKQWMVEQKAYEK